MAHAYDHPASACIRHLVFQRDEWAAMHRASTGTKAKRGAAVDHAEQVVLTAAVAYVESIYMSVEHPGPYLRRLQTTQGALRAAVKALKAAEVAS
jgi:hypothetical protein